MTYVLEISKAGFYHPGVLDIRHLHADDVYYTNETKKWGVRTFTVKVLDSIRKNDHVQLLCDQGEIFYETAKVTKIYEGTDDMVHFKTVDFHYILRKQRAAQP